MERGEVIALLALGISGFLAVLRYLEWRAKPELHVDVDWIAAIGEPTTLHIVVGNRGRVRGGIRALLLSPTEQHDSNTAFSHYPTLSKLPVMVEPGDLAAFAIEVKAEEKKYTLTRMLLEGGFRHLILIDHEKKQHSVPIPEAPPAEGSRRNSYGRVAKR